MAGIFTKRIWQPYICQPNELKREIKKKTGGQAKIWGGHGPPRPPLESPLFWNFLNYTIENAQEVRKKIFVFYYVAVISTITKAKEKIRACVSRYSQPACQ